MAFNIEKIVRKHILALSPYSSARDEYTGKEGVFLDANENPLGSVTPQNWNRYPDPYQWQIKEKLASIKKCKPEQIFLGNGSDEPIDLLYRLLVEPATDDVIILPPTYGMYQVCAEVNNAKLTKVNLTPDYQIDLPKTLAAITPNTKLIFVCSPNNPTGNLMKKSDIVALLENLPNGIVLVDEAYNDFTNEPSFVNELHLYPNLVVLQTFSKAWGLASLRIGMAFADESIVKLLNKIKYPYNINGATQELLLQYIDNIDFVEKSVKTLNENKLILQNELSKLPIVIKIHPSDANFILVQFTEAKQIFDYLISKKTILRDRSKVILCDNCIRISIGTEQENELLITQLVEFQG
ncbi:MAG: histidinol-phosphate transaminase [Pseudarcicella sp.]|nr:histidinol-phosphate transaminase [Pseudarcicella sp.]MBP6411038.1 histidinol-phosphate transaminase [Pseudarcicella sp.]